PQILNLHIDNLQLLDFLDRLEGGIVFTPNVDHLMKLQREEEFYQAYQMADYTLCDSRIVQAISGWLTKEPIVEQLAGSDVFPAYCAHVSPDPDIRIFLLGGTTPTSVEMAREKLNQIAGRELIVGGYAPPFGFEKEKSQNAYIRNLIHESKANVLAVGVGAPKQEIWIAEHHRYLSGVKLCWAIGATIDFLSGQQDRAPAWISRIGLEWAYRLLKEPKRLFRRYLIEDLPFFRLILQQKRGRYRNPWASVPSKNHEPPLQNPKD
ncbi:MAG: WecB/TagA/CpsF family glycosyltransferase, partial [Planctomycetota bacterium]